MKDMKPMKEYEGMTMSEQESFLAHASADLVQKMYYGNDMDGLILVAKNLGVILERAKNCIECLDMLRREGDVYAKIYLLLEYMGKDGMSEGFVSALAEVSERAQEAYARGKETPESEAEEREILKRLNEVMAREEAQAARADKERRNTAMKAGTGQGKGTVNVTI